MHFSNQDVATCTVYSFNVPPTQQPTAFTQLTWKTWQTTTNWFLDITVGSRVGLSLCLCVYSCGFWLSFICYQYTSHSSIPLCWSRLFPFPKRKSIKLFQFRIIGMYNIEGRHEYLHTKAWLCKGCEVVQQSYGYFHTHNDTTICRYFFWILCIKAYYYIDKK